ncbi:TonB-dependent siderophore receptor [Pseudomonas cerasi]|uniref:TonB-dependent siderophore receptor n=1 Tax=Pseudomonas cerasi TaxID=1583341 RepID=A0A193SR07_9PSED|nr:TonB-dependent siderophore receptor [Pseudomonas cerasi]SOS19510.1 TonB-dependent siderophore receptor [Pseudomonas cerasi]
MSGLCKSIFWEFVSGVNTNLYYSQKNPAGSQEAWFLAKGCTSMRRTLVSLCVIQAISQAAWADQVAGVQPAMELQNIDIQGAANAETAQGPVDGYRATRSASATRTDTSLHETPQSVSVVTREAVEDIGSTRLQDALDYAGGVGRANNFGGQGLTTFTVRGFTTG